MSTGYRRILNHLTNKDPIKLLIQEKGYRPKRNKLYIKLHWCMVCGKATYRKSGICSDRCFDKLLKDKKLTFEMSLWHTDILEKKI
jgi:predicted nucleic acid-binding Zn ribbon protein